MLEREQHPQRVYTDLADSLTAGNFGISDADGLGELNTFRAVFAGGLTSQILAGLADSIASDVQFNQPLTDRFRVKFVSVSGSFSSRRLQQPTSKLIRPLSDGLLFVGGVKLLCVSVPQRLGVKRTKCAEAEPQRREENNI